MSTTTNAADIAVTMTSRELLDREYLKIRSLVLETAASLDRIERGLDADADARLQKLLEAIAILSNRGTNRAEEVQEIFSLPVNG